MHGNWAGQDLRLALAMAEDVAQPTPVAASVNDIYKRAKAEGLGDQDFSAIIEAYLLDLKGLNH
jgi:glyoxylate/succinic semialdehyde reductase